MTRSLAAVSILAMLIGCAALLCTEQAAEADSPPPPPDTLWYDMDFNNNGLRDDGDLAKLVEYWIDFQRTGSLTLETNRANVVHDGKLDYQDVRLLLDEWLKPREHWLSPGPWTESAQVELDLRRSSMRARAVGRWLTLLPRTAALTGKAVQR